MKTPKILLLLALNPLLFPMAHMFAQEQAKLTVGYASLSSSFLPLWMAKEAETFTKNGLDNIWEWGKNPFGSRFYPVPQNAPHVSAGKNVPNFPEGEGPKATDACLPSHRQVSPWYGVYPAAP